jgi:hypothetical protein
MTNQTPLLVPSCGNQRYISSPPEAVGLRLFRSEILQPQLNVRSTFRRYSAQRADVYLKSKCIAAVDRSRRYFTEQFGVNAERIKAGGRRPEVPHLSECMRGILE